jgi:hypothetical protein
MTISLLDVERRAGGAFEVHFNEVPRGVVVALDDLVRLLEQSRASLLASAADSNE